MNIGIFGIGAIGSSVATLLKGDCTIHYFNRSALEVLRIQTPSETIHQPVRLSKVDTVPALDWVLVCLKTYHYPEALQQLQQLAKPSTVFVPLCNGIHTGNRLSGVVSKDRIIEVIVDNPVQPLEDGKGYRQLRKPILTVDDDGLGRRFKALFVEERCSVLLTNHFASQAWYKLVFSSSIGVLMLLSGQTCRVFSSNHWCNRFLALVREGLAVAEAVGVGFPPNTDMQMLEQLKSYPPDKGSSMLTDYQLGRPIEWDAKTDAIITVAKQMRVAVPAHLKVKKEVALLQGR